jgi:CspA family cold shock protein
MGTKFNQGRIKFFNVLKGYGFITDSVDPTKDYFFHFSGVTNGSVKKDDDVTFELETGNKGLKAINIKRIE